MLTFTSQKIVSSIKRQVYTGNKSTYSNIGSTSCYLRPLTEEQSSMNGIQYGLGFSAIFETSADVREGDRITIESVEYTVRGVVNHDRGLNTQYKRALLTKPENN